MLTLNRNDVHVWNVSLEVDSTDIAHLAKILSPDEQARVNRFHFEKDRTQFIISRGILRVLIGRYLGENPSHIQFAYNTFGKPLLMCSVDSDSLMFNVSHAGGKALYAFSKKQPLGIDLERIRLNIAFESIAKRFFSPVEITMFSSLQEPCKREAFFSWWTRKEAFIKAKGVGFSLGVDQFDVTLRPGEPARLIHTRYDERDVRHWSLHDIDAGSGFKAALAVRSTQPRISHYNWCP